MERNSPFEEPKGDVEVQIDGRAIGKRILKTVVALYAIAFAVTFAFFPRTMAQGFREGELRVILMPSALPVVGRAYWQFAKRGIWPFGADPRVDALGHLIETRGKEVAPGIRLVEVDMQPALSPGQEGRILNSISKESYGTTSYGAFVGVSRPGAVVQVGQYFCLSEHANRLGFLYAADVRCVRLFRKQGGYEWRELDGSRVTVAVN